MSLQYGKLCCIILLEHFGDTVRKVAAELLNGPKLLEALITDTNLSASSVREALIILIRHEFVIYSDISSKKIYYAILPDNILAVLRYPKYLLTVKSQFEEEPAAATSLIESALKQGQTTKFNILSHVKNCENVTFEALEHTFQKLVNKKFLVYSRSITSPQEVKAGLQNSNKTDLHEETWKVNLNTFHEIFRDDIITRSVSRRFDAVTGNLMKTVLSLPDFKTQLDTSSSAAVSLYELEDVIRAQNINCELLFPLKSYLQLMATDSCGFLDKTGAHLNVKYSVNFKNAFLELTWTTLENIVMGRFGQKAARIFRYMRTKQYVIVDEISKNVLIPEKEAKHLTYKLLEENFVQLRELSKPLAGEGQNKTFYVLRIELSQVVRTVLEMCYKSLFNAMTRREIIKNSSNKDLINTYLKSENPTQNLISSSEAKAPEKMTNEMQILEGRNPEKQQVFEMEVDEIGNYLETEILEKVQAMVSNLSESEILIDETVFILQLYLLYYH